MKKSIVFLMIAFFSILQGCGANMDVETKGIPEFNAAVVKYPGLLNNQYIKGKQLDGYKDDCSDGVHWENLVIHNLTLEDVEMRNALLKNVTFVDCNFIKVNFKGSTFDNVKFIRGKIYGYSKPDDPGKEYQSVFDDIPITRVLFDGTEFGQSVNMSFGYGIVVMRNIKADLPPEKNYGLLHGTDLQVRMDNCRVSNQSAVNLGGEKNTLYATNSSFTNAKLELEGPAAWIENCVVKSSGVPEASTVVVKNCQLERIGIGGGQDSQRYFLVGNTFSRPQNSNKTTLGLLLARENTVIDNAHLYLYADTGTHIPGEVRVNSGNIHIYGAEIDELSMRQQPRHNHLANLDLQNVKIGKGNWKLADIRHGKWENVEIYPPVDLTKAKFGEIIGHRVEFPRGTPWKNGELKITNSYELLTFDKPPVPTLEETGLAQFWKENDFPVENY